MKKCAGFEDFFSKPAGYLTRWLRLSGSKRRGDVALKPRSVDDGPEPCRKRVENIAHLHERLFEYGVNNDRRPFDAAIVGCTADGDERGRCRAHRLGMVPRTFSAAAWARLTRCSHNSIPL
jgi:hypothetical protein